MGDTAKIRTIGFFSPTGTGKTSLCEALLFAAGATTRLGKVPEGNTVMDFEPEDTKHKVSVSAASAYLAWKGHTIYMIDTPGNDNFLGDTYASARVVDGAVFVLGIADGVRFQSRKLWKLLGKTQVPRLLFLNKIDGEIPPFDLEVLKKGLGAPGLVLLHLPLREGNRVTGYVDVLTQKAYAYPASAAPGKADLKEIPIPAQTQPEAQSAKDKALESIAEMDDTLLEKYLDGQPLDPSQIVSVLRKGVHAGKLFPVLIGCATDMKGAHALLDAAVDLLPSPLDRPELQLTGEDGKTPLKRKADSGAPATAIVFRTVADPHIGQLSFFRICAGTVSQDMTLLNPRKKERERLGAILRFVGRTQAPVQSAGPGEIVAVAKLKNTHTGDTLCDPKEPALLPSIEFPSPVISYAISPKSKGDEDKVSMALTRLTEEDMTVSLRREIQTKEWILSGLGDVHIEVVLEKLKRKFGVEVVKAPPQIPYKETVKRKAQADGKYVRQSGGRGQYGWCWLEVEPLPRGTGYEFVDKIFGGAIPRNFIPSVEKGVQEALESGPLAGFPVVDIRVTLFDGKYHDVDSSDMAFRIAGSMGFKKAAEMATPVVLEPVVVVEVTVPEEHVGSVLADLNSRRARVQGMEGIGDERVIKAQVPMPEVMSYAGALTSITGGAGAFSYSFSHYEEVPAHMAQRLVDTRKKQQGEQAG